MSYKTQRLELKSKVENFVLYNLMKGHSVDAIMVLDDKEIATFVNKGEGTNQNSVSGEIDVKKYGILLNDLAENVITVNFQPPENPKVVPWYRDSLDKSKETNNTERMQGHARQFATIERCMDEMIKLERRKGRQYDEILRIRDDGVLLAPVQSIHKQNHGKDFLVNECDSWWGGVNDKAALMLRHVADTYFRGFRRALYVNKGGLHPDVAIKDPETLTYSILKQANVKVERSFHNMPVIPIRYNKVHPCLHGADTYCWEEHMMNIHSGIPFCKEKKRHHRLHLEGVQDEIDSAHD
mmetsp:Transcript_33810/g.54430  ORF Transcript_33810/g.54430 Transcript_33810/m.54430 type:complete len:296 (-) Transcript_33810:382-1269(-)